eukprot:5473314-Amphidinium_carterae.1
MQSEGSLQLGVLDMTGQASWAEPHAQGHVGLDDCIEIVTHTPQQLDTKMERLRERLRSSCS